MKQASNQPSKATRRPGSKEKRKEGRKGKKKASKKHSRKQASKETRKQGRERKEGKKKHRKQTRKGGREGGMEGERGDHIHGFLVARCLRGGPLPRGGRQRPRDQLGTKPALFEDRAAGICWGRFGVSQSHLMFVHSRTNQASSSVSPEVRRRSMAGVKVKSPSNQEPRSILIY